MRKFRKPRTTPRAGGNQTQSIPPAAALALEANELALRGDHAEAETRYREATRIDPHLAGAWLGLGKDFLRKSLFSDAFRCFERTITEAEATLRTYPSDRPSFVALNLAHAHLSSPPEAMENARRALEIEPDAELHGAMLFLLNHLPETTPEALYEEACRWGVLYAAPLAPLIRPHTNVPEPGRRLKLGYVSGDLYGHAIMKFVPPVFEHHNRSQFELFVYSVNAKTDGHTEILCRHLENFVPFRGSAHDLAGRIRADGIDILIDLGGHTMPWKHFQVFALKPAPVQVSWLGEMCTTGMATIDYFIGDPYMPCPGTEHLFTETVYRLPRVSACFRPAADVPVAPSPCLERGYITFGCFNNPAKLNRETVRLWSAVLRAVPRSRMYLKFRTMLTDVMQNRFLPWFAGEGITPDRIEFADRSPIGEYLAAYKEIDIALDPFPYNGGSTTLDTLWMGVPLVTLAGRLPVQCCGACALSTIGLADNVAHSERQYVDAASFLAGIVPKIPDLRRNVRQAMAASAFRDEAGVMREVEEAFRNMWRAWCRKQPDSLVTLDQTR